jgi:hypothetical protein
MNTELSRTDLPIEVRLNTAQPCDLERPKRSFAECLSFSRNLLRMLPNIKNREVVRNFKRQKSGSVGSDIFCRTQPFCDIAHHPISFTCLSHMVIPQNILFCEKNYSELLYKKET